MWARHVISGLEVLVVCETVTHRSRIAVESHCETLRIVVKPEHCRPGWKQQRSAGKG
jgi:hypothetical protein